MLETREKALVQDNPSLERDMHSKAIISRDRAAYQQRLAIRNAHKQKQSEIESLKSEVTELKDLVRQLISLQQKQ
jgi:hypothetical protein